MTAAVETAVKTIPILLQTLDLSMYPEGGELIAGLLNRVYVEAFTPARKPADLAAVVLDEAGREVARFRSEHEGRGGSRFHAEGKPAIQAENHRTGGDQDVISSTAGKSRRGREGTFDMFRKHWLFSSPAFHPFTLRGMRGLGGSRPHQWTFSQRQTIAAAPPAALRDGPLPPQNAGELEVIKKEVAQAAGAGPPFGGAFGSHRDRAKAEARANDFTYTRVYAHELRPERKPGDRVDFRETLFWHAGIKTSEQGAATVELALNDSVTTFRVFADAFTASGAIGSGSTSFESVNPFYLEPKLPLEVTQGDRILLPVACVNTTGVLSARPGEYERRYGIFGDLALTRSNHDTGRLRPP